MIVLVRHGPTEWSVSGRHTGNTDIPLTDEGRETAARLHDRLARYEFTTVLASPLRRARETADLAGFGDRAELEPDLREYDYGAYEGLTTDQIRERRPGWYLWGDGVPDGETPDQVGERADRAIARALAGGGDAALFGHGHILRVIGARWIELHASYAGHLALGTAAVCELGLEREQRVLRLWNDTSHIRGDA
ncbi:MAG TPA: histidine phosphatase family protein [Solirubrobacteraceae bacterium]|nr:histidine phosphatase family protein [Solirubrobacteraceae bacterium]